MAPALARREWTRNELAEQILAGQLLTVYRHKVLRLNSWLAKHPGGDLALLHYIGRDATDEIDAYHSEKTLVDRLDRFCVGFLAESERESFLSLVPPIMLGFSLRKTPAGDGVWVPLEGPVIALEAARAQRAATQLAQQQPSSSDPTLEATAPLPTAAAPAAPLLISSPSSSPPSKSILTPVRPTLELADLFPPPPSLSLSSPALQKAHATAYRRLHDRVRAAGLYTPPGFFGGYGPDLVRYAALFLIFAYCLWRGIHADSVTWARTGWLGGSAAGLGFLWHQLTFVAHDSGHTSVLGKGDYLKNRVLGMIVANWIGGLSLGWWCDSHNIHHLVTNHVEHDPDIQHVPFFAIDPVFFTSVFSTYYNHTKWFDAAARFLVPYQHKLYYIVLGLARFNLYALSYGFLVKQALAGKRSAFWWFEAAGVAFFWTWFGYGVLGSLCGWREVVSYLLVSHVLAAPVHVQIVLSHFARSTEDLGVLESFVHRQLRTTMDVICSPSIDFIHGGLDKQVTHHLFPRLPRHNLRQATLLVKDFCREQELEFAEYKFVEGNIQVLSVLQDVANQVQFIAKVAEAEAKGELSQGN